MRTHGRRLLAITLLTVGVAAAAPSSPAIVVSRADILWSDASTRTTFTQVAVAELMNGNLNGRFLLLDAAGPIATLALDRVGKTRVSCLSQVTFRVVGAIHHVPRDPAHVVVIGPMDAPAPKARLMFLGLAVAGHAPSEPVESLGVAAPPGGAPTYAVDLDGDRAADVLVRRGEQHGAFEKGVAQIRHVEEQWQRAREWTRTSACEWTSLDTLR